MKRSERKFSVGDWVYLKLQPCRQVYVKGKKGNHKLTPKFYGPFEILAKFGTVAYQLNLPAGSLIHPVFMFHSLKENWDPLLMLRHPLTGSRRWKKGGTLDDFIKVHCHEKEPTISRSASTVG
jgi:hypothetical protein